MKAPLMVFVTKLLFEQTRMEVGQRNVIYSPGPEIKRIIPLQVPVVNIRPSHIYILNLKAFDVFHDYPSCTVIN